MTKADLELLGYHNIESLPAAGQFRLFLARTRAGIGETAHAFVYPLTTARERDIREVQKVITSGELEKSKGISETYVVIPERLQLRPNLGSSKARVRVYEDLMWDKIQADLSEYMEGFQSENLLRGVPYVDPSFSDGGAAGVSPAKSPTEYLHSFLSGKEGREGIIVIQGNAMFGKTTLAESVAWKLSQDWKQFRVVPVLLKGQATWRDLAEGARGREIENLWDILSLVLKQGGLVHEGREGLLMQREELFRRIMQQGYVALIFDGFDELPKVRGARISPRDNFEWISGVAKDSSARILVTTRPDFWDREVGNVSGHVSLMLAPFDQEKSREYFNKYFEDVPENAEKAKEMYASLIHRIPSETENSFVHLPACARMVADYVQNGGKVPLTGGSDQQSKVRGFLMEILERERLRQQISIRAEDLHRAFEEMAVSYNGEFELSDLKYVVDIDIDECAKIPDHAFVEKFSDGKFRFRQDFLTHYLKASYVHRRLMESSNGQSTEEKVRKDGDLRRLICDEAEGDSQLIERVTDFLDLEDLGKLGDDHSHIKDPQNHLKSFLFHVIAKTVIMRKKNASRSELAEIILSLLGGCAKSRVVSNLFVQGEIRGISLGGWRITNSCFSNLRFAQCGNDGPRFVKCLFEGNFDQGNIKFNLENFEQCAPLNQEAQLWMGQIAGRGDTDDDIVKYMRIVLGRFCTANNIRIIDKMRWKTKITKQVEERFALLDIMLRVGFIEETMHGRRLKVTGDSIGDLRDFMDNGFLRGNVRRIFDAMKEKIPSPGN